MTPIHLPLRNSLLATLSMDAQQRLLPDLEVTYLQRGDMLHSPGHRAHHAYFPVDCVVVVQSMLESGATAGIGVVGDAGFFGGPIFDGTPQAANVALTLLRPGMAYRLAALPLRREFDRHDALLRRVLDYTQSFMAQIAQSAACNRHHRIEQQFCRWLLTLLDHVAGSRLAVTQVLVARLLGVRREGVTDAASRFQRAGIIRCERGLITVLDRPRLEEHSCECYAALHPGARSPSRLRPALHPAPAAAVGHGATAG